MKLITIILFIVFFLFSAQGMAAMDTLSDAPEQESVTVDDESISEDIQPDSQDVPDEDVNSDFPDEVLEQEDVSFQGEDDGFAPDPVEETVETESMTAQSPEDATANSRDVVITRLDQGDSQTTDKMNDEYGQLRQKRMTLDKGFQGLEAERKKLIEEKDGLKKKEDILDYNKRTDALNAKIQEYEKQWTLYNEDVQSFNSRVKENIDKQIEAANQANIDTNYEAFDAQYEESFEFDESDEFFTIDAEAPVSEQRAAILKYKDEIATEYQDLMKQRAAINKEKKLIKTPEEIELLNNKTLVLNEEIIKYGQKRAAFDKQLRNFNRQLETVQ